MKNKLKIGDQVILKDDVTGPNWIVTGIFTDDAGRDHYTITPEQSEDGEGWRIATRGELL